MAFPIQKEAEKEKAKENGAGTKQGMTAPSIIREECFVFRHCCCILRVKEL